MTFDGGPLKEKMTYQERLPLMEDLSQKMTYDGIIPQVEDNLWQKMIPDGRQTLIEVIGFDIKET